MPGNGKFIFPNELTVRDVKLTTDQRGVQFKAHEVEGTWKEIPDHWDVFLSYTRRDLELAENFARHLAIREKKLVYLDQWDHQVTGDHTDLVEYIREEIAKSDSLYVLLTEQAQLSWWVPLEVGVSMERKNSRDHIIAYKEGNPEIPSYFSQIKPLPDLCR